MINRVSPSDLIINTNARFAEVMAVPGSGKTYNLIERINHLITVNGIPPHKILAISHSTATASELKSRMKSFFINHNNISHGPKKDLTKVAVSTIHSFCLKTIRILSPNTKVMVKSNDVIAMLIKAIEATKQAAKSSGPSSDVPALSEERINQLEFLRQPAQIKVVLSLLEKARASKRKLSESMSSSQYQHLKPYLHVLCEVRRSFDVIKKKQESVDYGDMLVQATKIIEDNPKEVPYTHILVDEYQDCTGAQRHLLTQLGKNGHSIMVFGDEYQAIYGFASSNYVPLSSVLGKVRELSLPLSWRLTAQTAALATAIGQLGEPIQTNKNGEIPRLIIDTNLTCQIKHVVLDIQRRLDRGAAAEEIVVLARTKALLAPVEQLLLAKGIQTTRKGVCRDSRHALRILDLVHLVELCEKNPKSLKRENTRIAEKKLRATLFMLNATNLRWKKEALALMRVSCCPSLDGRYRLCSAIYLRLMGGVRNDPELLADVNRWEPFCRTHPNAAAVRRAILALDSHKVMTSTIHAAKGGEWDHVLIVGATEGLLPIYLARDSKSVAEERRLLYVAVTRARASVRLYHAPTHHARSRQHLPHLCSFLEESAVQKALLPRQSVA